ncbi:type VI secretion system protein TssA [Teredinibacter haidensis]|uniref:type VI secretion system protein TssA n=1 Tax=Teredinibacter haidensis TaxID=2731755 RepID=UPI0009489A9D|nr:type VI secretion system protein TssA [Teredinibacter haidensis]
MASPNLVDIDSLLLAISDETPFGTDIRDDSSPSSIYQTIKGERNSARALERQNIDDKNSSEADTHWRKIADLAPEILTHYAKDLEVACWYAEAMIRIYGFQGLRDAFSLMHGLIDQYWEGLYPMPDEYGMETRVACVAGLNGEGAEGVIIAPIRKIKITDGENPGPFSFWQYQRVLEAHKSSDDDTRKSKLEKLGYSLDDVEKSVAASTDIFFTNQRNDIEESIHKYKQLGTLLDEHCGIHEAPPTRTVTEVLEECLGAVNYLGKNKFPVDTVDAVAAATEEEGKVCMDENSTTNVANTVKVGPIDSREAAIKQLQHVAEYFRKSEPHSPISYVLEKAIKWGDMSLIELISELIPDSSSRERYSELTGVQSDD